MLRLPFPDVLLQELVYGLLMASGKAGGRADEHAGRVFLRRDIDSQGKIAIETAYPSEFPAVS